MREILFRAKPLSAMKADFIYGGYYPKEVDLVIGRPGSRTFHYIHTTDGRELTIDPETLGQFTGLVDANEVRIFEGDIIQSLALLTKYEVYYNGRTTAFSMRQWGGSGAETYPYLAGTASYKVVGNIHDNPGLIKESDL
jgi:hypothetical protein